MSLSSLAVLPAAAALVVACFDNSVYMVCFFIKWICVHSVIEVWLKLSFFILCMCIDTSEKNTFLCQFVRIKFKDSDENSFLTFWKSISLLIHRTLKEKCLSLHWMVLLPTPWRHYGAKAVRRNPRLHLLGCLYCLISFFDANSRAYFIILYAKSRHMLFLIL